MAPLPGYPRATRGSGLAARVGLFVLASITAGAVAAGALLPVAAVTGVAATAAVGGFESLSEQIATPEPPQSTVLLAADGTPFARLFYQDRVAVPLRSVSPVMRQAIVAIEDVRFYDHGGVDLRGTTRAIIQNFFGDGPIQGGSTITQQYVKNVLVESAATPEEAAAARERSVARKLREMRLALALENRLSKDEILERYLNIAYFGSGAYGIETAARRYFSVSAAELDLVQSATLAGIVQSPGVWDPLRNPTLSTQRRNLVLSRMVAAGFVSRAEADAASAVPVESILNPSPNNNGCVTSAAPFFCDYVLQVIRTDPLFGPTLEAREQLLRGGGLVIRTTLDLTAQAAADAAVRKYIPPKDPSRKAAAITMVRPGTGEIVAMAQNRDWGTTGPGKTALNYNVGRQFNGIYGAQAGSTFKVFTLAAALEQGMSPYEFIDSPSRKVFTQFVNCDTGAAFEPYPVRNSTRSGAFNMFQATAFSVNTYFVELEMRTGLCDPVRVARDLGLEHGDGSPLESVPSFTLGVAPVTTLGMAEAYATFAARGTHCESIAILSITDRRGNPLESRGRQCTRVLSREVADGVTVMLRGVIDGNIAGRTGARMTLGRDAAGKTGTTNENAAVWFVGYTPDLAAAVWVGDPRGGQAFPLKDLTINGTYYPQVFGSTMPGPIWQESMLGALQGTPPTPFTLSRALVFRPTPTTPTPTPSPTQSMGIPADTDAPEPSDPGTVEDPVPAGTAVPRPTVTRTITVTPSPSN